MLQEVWDVLAGLLGLGREAGELATGQVMLRALVVYACTLIIVRLGSTRLLSKATAFDVILGIMIGSVMSRGINGSAELLATIAGGAVLVAMHGVFAILAYRSRTFGDLVKGRSVALIEDGQVREHAMRKTSLSRNDLEEALRLQGLEPEPSRIRTAVLERNGTVSGRPRSGEPRVVDVSVAEGVQTVRIEVS